VTGASSLEDDVLHVDALTGHQLDDLDEPPGDGLEPLGLGDGTGQVGNGSDPAIAVPFARAR
jgi:hypothetical protein